MRFAITYIRRYNSMIIIDIVWSSHWKIFGLDAKRQLLGIQFVANPVGAQAFPSLGGWPRFALQYSRHHIMTTAHRLV